MRLRARRGPSAARAAIASASRRGHRAPGRRAVVGLGLDQRAGGADGRARRLRGCRPRRAQRRRDREDREPRGRRAASAPLDAEVLVDHRHDVAQRPLLARVGRRARCRTRSASRASRWRAARRASRRRRGARRPSRGTRSRARRRRAARPRSGSAAPTRCARARRGRPRSRSGPRAPTAPAGRGRPRRSSAPRAGRRGRRAARSAAPSSRRRGGRGSRPRRRGGRSSASRGRRPRAPAACARRAARARPGARGRARRPAPSARPGRPRSRSPPRGARTFEAGWTAKPSKARKRSISCSTCDCEWSEQTITACSSRNASGPPAACISRSICLSACASEATWANGPFLCECVSLSGSESSRKSNRSCSIRYCADAARVLVAHAGQPELRAAARAPRREQVGVEELLRPVDRVAEDGRREPGQRGLVGHLVAVAAAVHQVRGARRAHAGVVEALEHRRGLRREVLEVHVVDRVGQRLLEAERLRGLEARAVLDVAGLAAVVPVHRRDLVPVRAGAGRDRGGADRRHRRERGHAVVHVLAALDQQLHRRGLAARHRPLEHRGLHGVDDREDELLHRRMRRPAYFSPSRRRPPSSSHASPPTTRRASGGKRIERPAPASARPSA